MRIEIVMPQMGESTAEGTIIRWRKKVGERIEKEEAILEISTDKVDSEIPSPASGILVAISVGEGTKVPVGSVLAMLETDPAQARAALGATSAAGAGSARPTPAQTPAQALAPAQAPATPPAGAGVAARSQTPPAPDAAGIPVATPALEVSPLPTSAGVGVQRAAAPAGATAASTGATRTASAGGAGASGPLAAPGAGEARRFYSPLVRSIARREGVSVEELAGIPGSGLGHRVTKADLLAYLERRGGAETAPGATPAGGATPAAGAAIPSRPGEPVGPSAGGAAGAALPVAPGLPPAAARAAAGGPQGATAAAAQAAGAPRVASGAGVEVVEMDTMRRAIAEHMVRSVHTSPHVASIHEVDMSRVVKARTAQMASFERREGFKLTFTPFVVEAAVLAIKEFPWINSSVDGTKVLVRKSINIGVAVALDNGLIVPVIKGADGLNFVGVARAVQDLAMRARSRKLTPDDVSGGTFTITNIGVFGTLTGTPIIHQPQVAILGTGAIKKRVVVVDDAIAIRDMMYLSLSYDHRVVDGMLAGRFLARMTQLLEGWDVARVL